ncbi:MAG: TetR/AcrR family transcriptional regulator [Solirubrobacteraceae bacterium]
MESPPRTQSERSAATQQALVTAARTLWGERGYADVGTPEIARVAGVTRGAMYHQFADKAALFRAVLETVEAEVMQRLSAAVLTGGAESPAGALHAAVDAWLAIAMEPEIRRIVLLDATGVLGWEGFRDVSLRYSLGMTEQLLSAAIDAGELRRQPVRPLAQILIGAVDEAAMVIATADDRPRARAEVGQVLQDIIAALLTSCAE